MYSIIIITIIVLSVCLLLFLLEKPIGLNVKVEQRARLSSYINNTYRVETSLWINNFIGMSISLEKYIYEYNIKKKDIDLTLKKQLDVIYPLYLSIQKTLKEKK